MFEFDEIDLSDYEVNEEYDEDTEFKIDENECPRCTHGCNYCLMTGY